MENYKKHAMKEFKACGWLGENDKFKDEMQEQICNRVLKLLEVFSSEGHSGTTAPYTIDLFSKLASFKPISQLTGEDWEWNDVGEGMYQNNRCGNVFKDSSIFGGQAYDIDGKVFWEWYCDENGEIYKSYYTNGDSRTPITFPYTPTTEYVFSPTEKYPNEIL